MREMVRKIWPELEWIKNKELREKTLDCWVYAIKNSVLTIEDLETIPFSLLIKDCKVSFMNHKRTAVQLSVDIAKRMKKNFKNEIRIDMDLLISGAILIDVGKLVEYDKVGGVLTTSKTGKLLRHPFSGVAIADRFGLVKRSVESIIIHHADFVSFEPFLA
jgi:putative nucleotidyltransferase with HDIG domain